MKPTSLFVNTSRAEFIVFHKLNDATEHSLIERFLRIVFGHNLRSVFERT